MARDFFLQIFAVGLYRCFSLVCADKHLEARGQPWLLLLSANHLVLSVARDLLTRLGWLPREPPRSSCLRFLCVGVTRTHRCPQLFHGCWESNFGPLVCTEPFPRPLPLHSFSSLQLWREVTAPECLLRRRHWLYSVASWLLTAGKQVGVSALQRQPTLSDSHLPDFHGEVGSQSPLGRGVGGACVRHMGADLCHILPPPVPGGSRDWEKSPGPEQ